MTERAELWTGGWWRFTKYEVRGEHIGPADGAYLEWYDPWQEYNRSQFISGIAPPYQALIKLADDLLKVEPLEPGLPPKLRDLILDWCNHFGLLGILPHTALRIDLPRRFLSSPHNAVIVVRRHIRANGRWISDRHGYPEGQSRSVRALIADLLKGERGKLQEILERLSGPLESDDVMRLHSEISEMMDVPTEDLRALLESATDEKQPLGEILGEDHPDYEVPQILFDARFSIHLPHDFSSKPLCMTLPSYFPESVGEDDRFECPLPLSPDFWWRYRERLLDFSSAAVFFARAAAAMGDASRDQLSCFEGLVAPTGVSLSRGPGQRLQEAWQCPSLLSSFGRMLVQDLLTGKRLLRCESEICRKPFITDNSRARYCTRLCGSAERQRRFRAKAKQAQGAPKGDENGKA